MNKTCSLDDIFFHILDDPIAYPGIHNLETLRTNPSYAKLTPFRQMKTIFSAFSKLIEEKISEGQGIYLKNFGAFCFEVITEPKDIKKKGEEKKHVHEIRPCFIPAPELVSALVKYIYGYSKEEISASKSQRSPYQQGYAMVCCNPSILAHACFLEKKVVESTLENFSKALTEIIKQGKNIEMEFGVCNIRIVEKNVKYAFDPKFVRKLNEAHFETKLKKSEIPSSSHWKKESKLTQFVKKSNVSLSKKEYNGEFSSKIISKKTDILDKAALDLTGVTKTKYV